MVDATSLGKMTPEEQELAKKVNPEAYYEALFKFSIAHITDHIRGASNIIGSTVNGLLQAFSLHAEELSIFRAWEQEVRNNTFTADKLEKYLSKLVTFRERVIAEVEASSQPTKPN